MDQQQTAAEAEAPLSSQVLEYYRNYSQSAQLPRYLCGEMISEHGNIMQSHEIVHRPPLIDQDHVRTNFIPPTVIITDINPDNRGQISPTSSVASNRKLEWDNGADIGYENCQAVNRSLFRSCSLPALNTLERNIQKVFLRPDGCINEISQRNIANKQSDFTTTINLTSSNTTNSTNNNNHNSSDQSSSIIASSKPTETIYTSSSSSGFDKNTIYIPILVDSTPLAESTPNICSKDTIIHETPQHTQPHKPPRKNFVFSAQKSKSSSFDDLQNMQKLDETLANKQKYFQKYLTQKQQHLCISKPTALEYVVNKRAKDNISIAVQTENVFSTKNEVDNCISDQEDSSNSSKIADSFEYHCPEKESDQFEVRIKSSLEDNQIINTPQTFITKKSDSVSSESKSEKISTKLSANLISDVEKSVDLLTKLLTSKKYNETAKKYYIRKIVNKIVDSKYNDDKTSSSKTNESNTSETNHPKTNRERQIKSDSNLYDVTNIYTRAQRNPRFTLPNKIFNDGLFQSPNYTTDSSADKIQQLTNRSWKDDKTASERLIESQTPVTEQSDELVGFAQRERKSQLNWISNEINHLSKLKLLLEKRDSIKPSQTQSTAVYMITTDKTRSSCSCGNKPNVVAACKTPGHHYIKLQQCNHNQQEYKVRQVHCDGNKCSRVGNSLYCACHQQYTKNYQRTAQLSTSTIPTSSENENIDVKIEYPQPILTSTGVTCNLFPTKQANTLPNQQKDKTQPRNKAHVGIIPKSTSSPTPLSSSPKQQSTKISHRNVPTVVQKKQDISDNAKLISSELYQTSDIPTTSVRRYVFEIPIVDMQSAKKKSSDFGVNTKHIRDVGNVRASRNSEVKSNIIADQQRKLSSDKNIVDKQLVKETSDGLAEKKISTDKSNKLKQLPNIRTKETTKVLTLNQVGSFEIAPVVNKKLAPESSDRVNVGVLVKSPADALSSKLSEATKATERDKVTQTIQDNQAVVDMRRKSLEKISDVLKRNTSSQTLSLESYVRKLIADTVGSNNWPSGSVKSLEQSKRHVVSNSKPESSNKSKRPQQEIDVSAESSITEESSSKDQQGRKLQLGYTEDDKKSAKETNDLKKVDKKTIERQQKNVFNSTPSVAQNKDFDLMGSDVVEGTNKGIKNTPVEEGSKKDVKEQLKYEEKKRGDSRSNSSASKEISDTSSTVKSVDRIIGICQCCQTSNITCDDIYTQTNQHPLCQTCFQTHQYSLWRNRQPFYTYPNHICNCYTLIKTDQFQHLERNRSNQCACAVNQCACAAQLPINPRHNQCLNCNCLLNRCKLRYNSRKNNGEHKPYGISYTLSLETATEDDLVKNKADESAVGRYEEEVVLKVPKTASGGSADIGNSKEGNNEASQGGKENNGGVLNKKLKHKTKITKTTLQEYLSANRPSFIESAEQRRKCLIDLAYMREERCQKYKQLLAMTHGVPVLHDPQNNGFTIQKPRFFSTKEMKRLTAKNYKKLPEVQQRLLDNKDRQLKKANRLLSDIFNKKLRDKVLKGQPSLSTSVSVINLM